MKPGTTWILTVMLFAVPARADVDGTWRPVAAELGGQELAEAAYAPLRLTLTATRYTLTTPNGDDRGMVVFDASHTPATVDISGTEGPNQGKTFHAIYELAGDRLTICYDLSGKTRPARFETRQGKQFFLVTYKRDKP
jgi:uncharacterized protein (TIGR03067 family)